MRELSVTTRSGSARRVVVSAVALLVIFGLLAFAANRATAAGTSSPAAVLVAYDRSQAPPACRPAAIAGRIAKLFAVLDHGDTARLRELLEPEPRFQWYSIGAAEGINVIWNVDGYTPASVRSLFSKRRAAGERMRLVAASIGFDPRTNTVAISPFYRYRARDVAGGRVRYGYGKAAFACDTGRLRAWSGAVDAGARPRRLSLCGYTTPQLSSRARAGLRPVVCAR